MINLASYLQAIHPSKKGHCLLILKTRKDIPENALKFYGTVKRYTLQSFTSSEKYLLDIRKYKQTPGGDFKGCVPV